MSRLNAKMLQDALGNCTIGSEVVAVDQATSTNDLVLQRAMAARAVGETGSFPVSEGLVIFAEHQTAGRGQRGNRWDSPYGKGLWFSILLYPKVEVANSARLTSWLAEIITETIREQFSIPATVKSPNDVLIDGRKVAGVLVEMRAQLKGPHIAIAGIGINVDQTLADFPANFRESATSLTIALNRPVDRETLAAAVLRNLDRTYRERFTT